MLIGQDYERIEFTLFGLDLVEPNAFIGDFLILIIALFFASEVKKLGIKDPFTKNWRYFFLIFGIGMFLGGLGHVMFKYWGFYGKYLPWYIGITSVFFIEKAMLSLHKNEQVKSVLKKVSRAKLVLALIAETFVFLFADMSLDHSIGLQVPAITTAIGLIYSLAVLGYQYIKQIDSSFKYMFYSVFTLLPSALFVAFKINLHPYFDKNDFSHVILIIGMVLYFKSIKGYALMKNLG